MSSDFSLFYSISETDSEDSYSSNEVFKTEEINQSIQIFGLKGRRVLLFSVCVIFIFLSLFVVSLIFIFSSVSMDGITESHKLLEKKDLSFLDFGEEENKYVSCRCSAECTIYDDINTSDDDDDFIDERRRKLFPTTKETLVVVVAYKCFEMLFEVCEKAYDKRKNKEARQKAAVEFRKHCDEAKDIQCECEDDYEDVPILIWECKASCFNDMEFVQNFPVFMKRETVMDKSKIETLSFCKEIDEKKIFNLEEHGSYIKDNYIHCRKLDVNNI